MFARAVSRGELDSDAAVGRAVDVVFGVFWYRLMVGHAPLEPAEAPEHVDALLRTLGVSAR
jgi:hypothetical protein